jgi:TIR domain
VLKREIAQTMASIFICYRHGDDAGSAGRLADDLEEHFPNSHVFRDVEGLEPGTDFTVVIAEKLRSCAALLAVIGPRWLAAGPNGRARLHDPQDFVCLEIATALSLGTFIIPVLVGKAEMPTENQLPAVLRPLANRQAHEMTDRRWDTDLENLVKALAKRPELVGARKKRTKLRGVGKWKIGLIVTFASIGLLMAATKLTVSKEPEWPDGLVLIDLGGDGADTATSCIKPRDCDTRDGRSLSELIRLNSVELRYDPAGHLVHLMLDLRWTLRQGRTDLFHRGYTGRFHYTVEYQRPRPDGGVVLGGLERQGYSLAPVNGLLAYLFGWAEIPFLVERDDAVAAEMRRRLDDSSSIQGLP